MSRPKIAPADQAAAKMAANAQRLGGGALISKGEPKQMQAVMEVNGEPTRFVLGGTHFFTDECLQTLANLIAGNVANVVQALVPALVDEIVKTRLEEAGLAPDGEHLTTRQTIVA